MAKKEEMNERIFAAVLSGDVDTLQDCIYKGAEVNSQNYSGQTPLHLAAWSDRTEVVDLLLKSGASPSVVDKQGKTPLHLAAVRGRTEVVDLLLKSGPSPFVVDKKGKTPLHLAAWIGRTEVVDLLLKSGASPSVVDKQGQTPLHRATEYGRTEVEDLLLKAGASPSVVDEQGQTPLHMAAEYGRKEVVDLLLKAGASPSVVDNQGQTPLHRAARIGRTELVDLLLKSGASSSVVNKQGETPLHLAAVRGRTEVVDLLLKSGASPFVVDKQGQTPLHRAADYGRTEVEKRLLRGRASSSVVNKQGQTPLHMAAEYGRKEVVDLLLKAGASPSVVDNQVQTPLHRAADYDRTEVEKRLLRGRASSSVVNKQGQTPLHRAADYDRTEVEKRLLRGRASSSVVNKQVQTPLHRAADYDRTEVEKRLLRGRASSSVVNKQGQTPLHRAADYDRIEVEKRLLRGRASSSVVNKQGQTPLHRAAVYGRTEVEKRLLRGRASSSVVNKQGQTPLHRAADYGRTEVEKRLLRGRASSSVVNKQGQTPLHRAADYDRTEVEKRLLRGRASSSVVNKQKYMDKVYTMDMLSNTDEIGSLLHLQQDHSSMLKRLLGHGSYESFEMRVMVTGQFGVGKTSLVMILVGDEASHEAQPTDGISLLEGRCGLDIDNRQWILIAKDDYNALDVVFRKVLMTSDLQDEATGPTTTTMTEDTTSATEDTTSTTSKRHHPKQAIPKEKDIKDAAMVSPKTIHAAKVEEKSKEEKMKSKITKKEIKKKMENVLKRGDFKMKIGRLMFWDFGGQYIYYTTHQTFMTYRALFLVVFDGSTDLFDEVPDVLCFPGQHGTPTPAVFLQHWVNSILTYCKGISGEIPQILFVATHKDKISEKDVEKRRTSLYSEIDKLFKNHDGRNHLVLSHRLFVNAVDKNDPEIEKLKNIITELTFSHPCWGERMPNAWVPLELEIAELTAEGRQIMSLKEIEELNNDSEVSTLSAEDLKAFLQIQHSLGKIVYFDTPQLKDYVVISPLYMVEVMKSFVTERQFWPKDTKAKETFNKMSDHGVIQKNDLFSLWERKEFSKIHTYKEYVFDMLVHLDILSEQRRYDQYTGSRLPVEDYFVPCMVTKQYTTNYMKKECTPQRAICLAFVFKGSMIPPALPNRLIGACLSMWGLKTYEGKKLLFAGFIGLTYDKSHDIVVRVESNKILLFILHKTSKGLIVPDIATGVKECLYATLERISEFYQSASNKQSSQQQPFHVELACSNFKCFLPEPNTEATASESDHVKCSGCNQNYEVDIWNQDKTKDDCPQHCQGLSEDALDQNPSDSEIFRFSAQLDYCMMYDLVIHLGNYKKDWENMKYNHPTNIEMTIFLILIKWRNEKSAVFRNLDTALKAAQINAHLLCQVRRVKRVENRGLLAHHVDYVPTDEILDALAPNIGIKTLFHLGIELGLRAVDLENIEYQYQSDPVKQTSQVLYKWRDDMAVKATLGVLNQVLINVGIGVMCLETVVEEKGVEKRYISRKHDVEGALSKTQDHDLHISRQNDAEGALSKTQDHDLHISRQNDAEGALSKTQDHDLHISRQNDAEGALSKTQDHDLQAKDSKSNVKTEEKTITDGSQRPSQARGWRNCCNCTLL